MNDVWGTAADLMAPPTTDPVASLRLRLGVEPWSKQQEIIQSVFANPKTAVRSCHDAGKSFSAAAIVCEWLSYYLPGEAFAVTTAPTFAQVRAILWREIGKLHRKNKLVGRTTQTEWHIGDELVGYGRKPSDYDVSAFQGIHAAHVLVVLDEACGVPRQLWDAVEAITTNEGCSILAIGNPDVAGTAFEECFQEDSGWNTIRIRAEDTPNFTGERVPDAVRKVLLSRAWVDDKKKRWGLDDPRYIAKVLAEFPKDVENGVVPWSWLMGCKTAPRCPYTGPNDEAGEVALGVDVGGGGDETVIRERRDYTAGREWTQRTPKAEEVTSLVMNAVRVTGATIVNIDSIGVGWGVCGSVRSAIQDADDLRGRVVVNEINVGESPSPAMAKIVERLRDEVWWNTRLLAEAGQLNLTDLDMGGQTVSDLIAPTWGPSLTGKVKVEKKSDTKERIGRSPDRGDAFNLAYYKPQTKSKAVHDY